MLSNVAGERMLMAGWQAEYDAGVAALWPPVPAAQCVAGSTSVSLSIPKGTGSTSCIKGWLTPSSNNP